VTGIDGDKLKLLAPLPVASVVFAQGLTIPPSLVLGLFKERPWTDHSSFIDESARVALSNARSASSTS